MRAKTGINIKVFLTWLLVALLTLGLYIYTRTPAVGLIDSGELAAGCYLLNILHPTGYPIYTILGRFFSLLPAGSIINRLALLSAVFSVAGLLMILLLCQKLNFNLIISSTVALLIAVSPPLWSVSVDAEVYSLTFFMNCLLWFVLINSTKQPRLLLLSYLAGLTLTNHLTGLWTVIGVIITLILTWRCKLIRPAPLLSLLFLLGLSPYLFLIIRARAQPLFAWGNPVDFERFWWHITGRQYRVWMFSSSFSNVLQNGRYGILLIARTFGYLLIPPVIYGWVILLRQNRPLAIGLTITTLLSLLYAVNYGIPDIDAYYLPAITALALFAIWGMEALYRRFRKYLYLMSILPLIMLVLNYPHQNRNQDWVAYDQALNTLKSADSGAIIITDWWDIYAPIFYLQEIEKMRPDVSIIDKELLRRSWYFNYLEKKYPLLTRNSRNEIQHFLHQLLLFEYRLPYDPIAIQESYIRLLRSFFFNNPARPVYTTFAPGSGNDAQQLLTGFQVVPIGILYQVRADSLIPEFDYRILQVRIPRFGLNERSKFNLDRYRIFAQQRIALLSRLNRTAEAQLVASWYKKMFSNYQ
uniref:DUF2723 domain-containing protein n=1 Tax=candidate division WOR-3 bacterium TaxID=2052148 RepID=A0A7V3UZE9_UNCW3